MVFGGLALVLMTLFPPWAEERWRMQQLLYWPSHVDVLERRFDGYRFIFSDKPSRDLTKASHASGQAWEQLEYHIHWRLLAIQWFVLAGVVVSTFVWIGRGRRNAAGAPGAPPLIAEIPIAEEGRGYP
jgi:hypothetical protein